MNQHDKAVELVQSLNKIDYSQLNEATTRSRIIDTIIYEVLSWPKNAVVEEEHNQEGYSDYVLKDISNENLIIIEAKKQGVYFNTPMNHKSDSYFSYIKMRTLLTDNTVSLAIKQVRAYCLDSGAKYGCITNGTTWIFFTAFSSEWENLNGFVINSIDYFSDNFTEAYNQFGYENLVKRNSLSSILDKKFKKSRITYSVKDKIVSYSVPVDLNIFARYLSKAIKYYFGDLVPNDVEFIKHCYVDESLYRNTKKTLENLLIDNVSPYLARFGIINYKREKLSKKLSKKIENFIEYSDNKHIVIIYGDRGSGKSTFIRKLIYFDIPENVRERLNIVYINLLDYAAVDGDQKSIREVIWKQVLAGLDDESILNKYDKIEECLFKEELKTFREQLFTLYGDNKEKIGTRIEEKIIELVDDYSIISKKLADYQRKVNNKEIVLILDNTDQYSAEIQDFCFQMVSEIFSLINCLSIITIREERFFRSKNLGVLDAYETTQYHISSPQTDKVFIQRLTFLLKALDDDMFFYELMKNHEVPENEKQIISRDNFKRFLIVFKKDFDKQLNLFSFLYSCAQKDIRKSLDMFREYLFSGYMNINEILSADGVFNLQLHQVLKPLMTPKKYFYDEESSSVPNIYKIRFPENGSHFTSIRILQYLNFDRDEYMSLSVLHSKYNSVFNMQEDFDSAIHFLIEFKLIESSIKVDSFVPEVENIKITPFGIYFLKQLIFSFTYIDLVCTDCHFYNEGIAGYISRSANEEYELFDNKQRGYRLIKRVQKTNKFIEYLLNQEADENTEYNIPQHFKVTIDLKSQYEKDISKLKKSALRQHYTDTQERVELKNFFDTVNNGI